MKSKVLLIYIDSSARLGILPYLSSVFSSFLDFESIQLEQLDPAVLRKYDLVLYSSALCESKASAAVQDSGLSAWRCVRELNYTYIHKVLEIPSLSKVCIVSDRKKNCEAILDSLIALGFTQYIYSIYYPGGPLPDPSFQHAITPGESRFVPSSIRNVIDIGNRNVDIATLCFIVNHFHLPESILNYVTSSYAGYISNFMRHIHAQSEESLRYITVRDKLLDTMNLGICTVNTEGQIQMANQTFCHFLSLNRGYVKKQLLTELLEAQGVQITFETLLKKTPVSVKSLSGEQATLLLADSFESSRRTIQYLFLLDGVASRYPVRSPIWNPEKQKTAGSLTDDSNLNHLISQSRRISYTFRTLASFADSRLPVLLMGEAGLCQQQLAQYIHGRSSSTDRPFYTLDAGHPFTASIRSCSDLEKIVASGKPGTLFIEHLERASQEFQYFLNSVLGSTGNFGLHAPDKFRQTRMICSCGTEIQEQISSNLFLGELFFELSTLSFKLTPVREMKEMIPAFYEYILNELFPGDFQKLENMFTNQLLEFLIDYDYPGNIKELTNLCLYFHHIFNGKKLTLAQLPSYIDCTPYKKADLSGSERAVLQIIKRYPHTGRNKILVLLEERGISLTPHQIRTVLTDLSDKAYIQVMKTKQGCTITELGDFLLQCCEKN